MARKKNDAPPPTYHVIHEGTPASQLYAPVVNGEIKGHGLVPRDYSIYPAAMFDPPDQMPLIPQGEWAERIREKTAKKSWLRDIRDTGMAGQQIPSLDQNGQGYCWAYSTTSAVMLLRALMNLPYVRLSAHAIACKIKGFRDEGGWCGLSAKYHREVGCPSVAFWPEKSMSRAHDKPETWDNAKLHKVTEEWVDLSSSVYDQNLTWAQNVSCLLSNIPCANDFNHWSHSVCSCFLVNGNDHRDTTRAESGKLMTGIEVARFWGLDNPVTAGIGNGIWNSWTDGWGDDGMGVLTGNKAIPNGAVALRATGASVT